MLRRALPVSLIKLPVTPEAQELVHKKQGGCGFLCSFGCSYLGFGAGRSGEESPLTEPSHGSLSVFIDTFTTPALRVKITSYLFYLCVFRA